MPNYQEDLPEDIAPFRGLLEEYSHIPPHEVDAHLHTIVSTTPLAAGLNSTDCSFITSLPE